MLKRERIRVRECWGESLFAQNVILKIQQVGLEAVFPIALKKGLSVSIVLYFAYLIILIELFCYKIRTLRLLGIVQLQILNNIQNEDE